MLDLIRNVFRHPIFEANHSTGEAQKPVAAFRPIREYATDGVAYRERRCAIYDFTADGGAVGEIVLDAPVFNNETIVDGLILTDVDVTSAGGTATIAIGTSAGSAADSLKAATAEATYAVDTTLPLVPLGHGTGEVKLTADGFISITVAVEALTGGKIYVFYDVVFTGS